MKISLMLLCLLKFSSFLRMCSGQVTFLGSPNLNGEDMKLVDVIGNDLVGSDLDKKCSSSKNPDILLSRKKRGLVFPDGTRFLITASLVKAILVGIPLGWNVALELDVFYDMPKSSNVIRTYFKRLRVTHRQRRDLWNHFEGVINMYGLAGQACVLKAICEAQQYLAPKNTSLVHDILRIIFSAPNSGGLNDPYTRAHKETDCKIFHEKCPFSLIQFLLSYQRA